MGKELTGFFSEPFVGPVVLQLVIFSCVLFIIVSGILGVIYFNRRAILSWLRNRLKD